jgi:hypothetical protein
VLIIDGTQVLFGLTPEDLPQGNARTLDAAGKQIVATLQDIHADREEQRRWPNLLRSSAESAFAAFVRAGQIGAAIAHAIPDVLMRAVSELPTAAARASPARAAAAATARERACHTNLRNPHSRGHPGDVASRRAAATRFDQTGPVA